jgi:hypothetical protein
LRKYPQGYSLKGNPSGKKLLVPLLVFFSILF